MPAEGFSIVDVFTTYALSRTAEDGRQLLSFSIRQGRYVCPLSREFALLGADGQTAGDILVPPYLEYPRRHRAKGTD